MRNLAILAGSIGLVGFVSTGCNGDKDEEDTDGAADTDAGGGGDTDDTDDGGMDTDDTSGGMDTDDTDTPGTPEEGQVVFVMTNDAVDNEVVGFRYVSTGLEVIDSWSTGGQGLGVLELPLLELMDGIDPLVSEGSLHRVGDHLVAVNAGSGSVTAFSVAADGMLTMTDTLDVGAYPNTLGSRGDQIFVGLSPGTDAVGGIAQLTIDAQGALERVGGLLPLSVPEAHPARVLVTDDFLVVSEVTHGMIDVWPLDGNEPLAADARVVRSPSAGPGPFGISPLGDGRILVNEAAPEMPGGAGVSTYQIESDGLLTPITANLRNGQSATCWGVVAPDGMHAFTSNTASGTLSSYSLEPDGAVALNAGVAATVAGGPIDMSLSADGSMLYVLLGGTGEIAVHDVTGGMLSAPMVMSTAFALPIQGSQGIVAW